MTADYRRRGLALWPLWILLIAVAIATWLLCAQYKADKHWIADYSSIVGVGLSVAGFILTIAAIVITRTAKEVQQTERRRSDRENARIAITDAMSSIQLLRNDFGDASGWRQVPTRLQAVIQRLLSLERHLPPEDVFPVREGLSVKLVDLQEYGWSYQNALRKDREPRSVAPRLQKVISELELQLSRISVELEKEVDKNA